jgi:hypothetical protein
MTTTADVHHEAEELTATRDCTYNIISFVHRALDNSVRLENYARDAAASGDIDLENFFRQAQLHSHKGAVEGRKLLAERLAREVSGS